jgi:hypothetical protein
MVQNLKGLISRDLEVSGSCSLQNNQKASSRWEKAVSFMI